MAWIVGVGQEDAELLFGEALLRIETAWCVGKDGIRRDDDTSDVWKRNSRVEMVDGRRLM